MSSANTTGIQGGTSIFRRPFDNARIQISRLSATDVSLTKIFHSICQISADTLAVERVGIWLFVNERSAIRCVSLFERSKRIFSDGAMLQVSDFPSYFAGLKVRRTLQAQNAAHDPNTNELKESYLDPLGITSLLNAPIWIDGEMYGVVCHEHVGFPREWTTEERDFAGSVADCVALKMKSVELGNLRAMALIRSGDQATTRSRESLQTMAAGVAHDFRNFLAIISSYAEEIRAQRQLGADTRVYADEIVKAVQRGLALTVELMEVAQKEAHHPRVISVAEHLRRFLPSLEPILGQRHRLEFHSRGDGGRIFIEPSQLERALMNLVVNARDAMREGGSIKVALEDSQSESDGSVTISVEDSGEGIPPHLMGKIFDPFFTTKPRGTGTGLGLSIVREAVEHAGGSLEVKSREGNGTTFFMKLPRVSAS